MLEGLYRVKQSLQVAKTLGKHSQTKQRGRGPPEKASIKSCWT